MFIISPLLLDKEVQLIEKQYLDRAAREALVKKAKHSVEKKHSIGAKLEISFRQWLGYKFIWFGERLVRTSNPNPSNQLD